MRGRSTGILDGSRVDLNNDGWLDMVVPQIEDDRSFILWGGPEVYSMDRCQMLSVTRVACARVADLTENGYPDLILGGHMPTANGPHDSFVYIYWNGPKGIRQDRRTILPASTIHGMCLSDFNGDGLLDLFVGSYHDGKTRDIDLYLYWNRPGRVFSAEDRLSMFMHSASGCLAADFDEDGHTDLAIVYHKVRGDHLGHSAVWWNGPDGFSPDRVTRLPTAGPHRMTTIEPGNLMDRGPEGYYVSRAFQLPEDARATQIAWDAELAPKTWVHAPLRCAHSEAELATVPWRGPGDGDDWCESGQNVDGWSCMGGWIQYRLALGAIHGCGTPRVTAVHIEYA